MWGRLHGLFLKLQEVSKEVSSKSGSLDSLRSKLKPIRLF